MASEDKISVRCPHCGVKISIKEKYVGKEGRCPSCSKNFTVEKPTSVPEQPKPKPEPVNPFGDLNTPSQPTTDDAPTKTAPDDKKEEVFINWGAGWRKLAWWVKGLLCLFLIYLIISCGGCFGNFWNSKPQKPGSPDNVNAPVTNKQAIAELAEANNKIQALNAEINLLRAQQGNPGNNPALQLQINKLNADLTKAKADLAATQADLVKAKAGSNTFKFKEDVLKNNSEWRGKWGKKDLPSATYWKITKTTLTDDKSVVEFEATFQHRGDGKFMPLLVEGNVAGKLYLVNGLIQARFIPMKDGKEDTRYGRMSITLKLNDGGTIAEGQHDLMPEFPYRLEKQ